MKKVSLLLAGLFFLLLSINVHAQSTTGKDYFAGKWSVLVKGTPNGDARMFFVLDKKDSTLTGSVQDSTGTEISKIDNVELNGNTATVVSAPVGLQLNRQLNNNFYAFTGVSLAPTYINFNRSFLSSGIKPHTGNGFKSDNFELYSSVNMGLMYVNDARTFSISSSIGVARSSYPMLLYPPANMQRISTFTPTPAYR